MPTSADYHGSYDTMDTSNTGHETKLHVAPNTSSDRSDFITTVSSDTPTAPPRISPTKKFKPMYTKRGQNTFMEEALQSIKGIAQEDVSTKTGRFDTFAAYIASKLRPMNSKNAEYYEIEILKLLTQPRLQ